MKKNQQRTTDTDDQAADDAGAATDDTTAPTAQDGPQDAPETPQSDDQADPAPEVDHAAQLAQITAERDALKVQVARLTIAAETGVPADVLTGTTEQELRDQAQKIAAYAKAQTPMADYGAGTRTPVAHREVDPVRKRLGR